MMISHPGDPAVAAALQQLHAAQRAIADHVDSCRLCQAHTPFRYRTCTVGRSLAAAVVGYQTAAGNADAAAAAAAGEA